MEFDREVYEIKRARYIHTQADIDLDDVRNYLDNCHYFMPRPDYIYNREDRSTWKYCDSKMRKDGDFQIVENPHFKFKADK